MTVFRATMPEGFGPPRHIHTREDEVFLVLEGEARFDLDGEHARRRPRHERLHAARRAAHLPGA